MLKTFSLYRKLLTLCRAGHDQGKAWGMNRTWVTLGWTEGSERLPDLERGNWLLGDQSCVLPHGCFVSSDVPWPKENCLATPSSVTGH